MWIFDKLKKPYIKYSKKKADGGIVLHKDESFVISSPYRNRNYVQSIFHAGSPQSCLNVEITATHKDTRESLTEAFESKGFVSVLFNDTITLSIVINSMKETFGRCGYSLIAEGGTCVSEEFIYE